MKNIVFKKRRQMELFKNDSIAAITAVLFLIIVGIACRNAARSDVNLNANPSSVNSNSTSSNSSAGGGDAYKKLLDKKDELIKFSPPVKLDPRAIIKGKVFIVTDKLESKYTDLLDNSFSRDRKAFSLEELETVIRVVCARGKFIGNYEAKDGNLTRKIKAYGVECQAALVDYRAPAIVARESFSNNVREEAILDRNFAFDEYQNPPPMGEIQKFFDRFPVDKVLPTMAQLEEKELVKIPVTVDLKPDAAIRGKIKIVEKLETGLIGGGYISINGYNNYGFPYDKLASKPEELETLVRIVCVQGSPIGKFGKETQYASKCEVSLIDYKTLTVIAQKTIENKTLDESRKDSSAGGGWIVAPPKKEIEDYLKSFPTS